MYWSPEYPVLAGQKLSSCIFNFWPGICQGMFEGYVHLASNYFSCRHLENVIGTKTHFIGLLDVLKLL